MVDRMNKSAEWPDFSLLETVLYSTELVEPRIHLLDEHLTRLLNSARYFQEQSTGTRFQNIPTRELLQRTVIDAIKTSESSISSPSSSTYRVRLLVDAEGIATAHATPLPLLDTKMEAEITYIALDTQPTPTCSPFLRHKTTNRGLYDDARKRVGCPALGSSQSPQPVPFDVVLFNEENQVTETSICNIAVEMQDGRWLTPAVECGLLPGTQRAYLLSTDKSMYPGILTVQVLKEVAEANRRIRIFNSVRRSIDVRLLS